MKTILLAFTLFVLRLELQAQIPSLLTKRFNDIRPLTSSLYAFSKDGKKGVVNAKGIIVCKPIFSEIRNSVFNLLTVSNDTLWGIATLQGNQILPHNFEEIVIFGPDKFGVYKNGVPFIVNRQNKFVGDLNEKIRTPYSYVKVNGKIFTPPQIASDEKAIPPSQENLTGKFGFDQKKVFVTNDGDTTIVDCDEVEWLLTDYIFKYNMGDSTWWGFASSSGENIHTPSFQSIELYDDKSFYLIVKRDGKFGLLDFEANEILPIQYESISCYDNNNFITVAKTEIGRRYYGILNQDFEFILPLQKNYIKSEGHIYDINGKSYVDKFMKPVIPFEYHVHQYSNGEFAVTNGKKGGIVNEAGYFVIPPEYELVTDATGDNTKDNKELMLYEIILNGKSGIVNRQNKLIVPAIYDDIKLFYNGLSVALSKGKEGVITKMGKTVIPFVYDKISFNPDENNLYVVTRNNVSGMLNTLGKTIVKEEYDYINDEPENGLYLAKKRGKWGFFNPNGKTIINFTYDMANPFYSETAEVEKDGEKFRINRKGEKITQ